MTLIDYMCQEKKEEEDLSAFSRCINISLQEYIKKNKEGLSIAADIITDNMK